MINKVSKRDGRVVNYNRDKIVEAMKKAFLDVDKEITEDALNIINRITNSIENSKVEQMDVEDIQDHIEKALMASSRKDVAKKYILYRDNKEKIRRTKSKFWKNYAKKLNAKDKQNQNANIDEDSFGGRIGEASEIVSKEYALNNLVSPMARENHLENKIYIHDLGSYAVGSHNCLSIPFDDLLANGFNTRQTDVRPANSVNTAFQLLAVIFQLQSLQQFGGVSATHLDWTMIPYVRKSFYKHYKNVYDIIPLFKTPKIDDVENISIEDKIYRGKYFFNFVKRYVYKKALKLTIKETQQAVEGMYHNLNY